MRQLEPAVNATLEALLGKGRTHDVAAKSLELGTVVAVNELLFVDTDAQRFGDRLLFGFAVTELARCSACQHSQYRLTRSLSGDGNAKSCCLVATKQAGLIAAERIRSPLRVSRSAFARVGEGALVVPRAFAALLAKGLRKAPGGRKGRTARAQQPTSH